MKKRFFLTRRKFPGRATLGAGFFGFVFFRPTKMNAEEGLEIVRTCRKRYDGRIRNPFNEYECGHWYARAMSSYGLIQALTGMRYDAVDKTLYIDSRIGNDFTCFISTEIGFGLAGLQAGKPFVQTKMGTIRIAQCFVSGREMEVKVE